MNLRDRDTTDARFSAQVFPESRTGSRIPADRQVTLRTVREEPVDALVEDLSLSGFAMSTVADLRIGSIVGLSIGGALRRRVKIVRRAGLTYGCQFLTPLSEFEVITALQVNDVVEAGFVSNTRTEHGPAQSRRLSYLAKLYVLIVLIGGLWAILIYSALQLA